VNRLVPNRHLSRVQLYWGALSRRVPRVSSNRIWRNLGISGQNGHQGTRRGHREAASPHTHLSIQNPERPWAKEAKDARFRPNLAEATRRIKPAARSRRPTGSSTERPLGEGGGRAPQRASPWVKPVSPAQVAVADATAAGRKPGPHGLPGGVRAVVGIPGASLEAQGSIGPASMEATSKAPSQPTQRPRNRPEPAAPGA